MMTTLARTKKLLVGVILLIGILHLSAPGWGFAASAPTVSRLLTMTGQSFPVGIAGDGYGNIYVADGYLNQLRVYDYKGSLKNTVSLSLKPTQVAVSPTNVVHVVENDGSANGKIEMFSTAGASLGSISVRSPKSITFESTGGFYMIEDYKLVKYDSSYNKVASYGGYGKTAGYFVDPSTVALNETAGEVYVLDRGGSATEGGYSGTPVWRVQAFNASGQYLRSFSNYGFGIDGKVGTAQSFAVDKSGRIYVADDSQGIVVVYDSTGTYIKTIYENSQPIVNPVSISFNNDRIYVSSVLGSYAAVFGVDSYAAIAVDPLNIDVAYQQSMKTVVKSVNISNTGGGNLSWTAASDSSWLSVAPASGNVAGNASAAMSVSIDGSAFAAGSVNTGTVVIASNGGTETVSVKVTAYAAAQLVVTPTNFDLVKMSNESLPSQYVTIQIVDDMTGSMMWQAVSDSAWLSLSSTSGVNNMLPTPQLTIQNGMLPGAYTGHIAISADGVSSGSAVVTVKLTVSSSGKLTVTTNNTDATFTITGPAASYSGSGMSYVVDNVDAGSYTINYGAIKGYKTPTSQTQTIVTGGSLTFSGEYVDLRKQLNVIASHGPGPRDGSTVTVFKSDGTSVFSLTPFADYYGAHTTSGDVDGDGNADIIVSGGGYSVPSGVKAYSRDGSPIAGFDLATPDYSVGGMLAAADFDGDGKDEVITADGSATSIVRVYGYSAGSVVDTGLYFEAYPGVTGGVNVAAADIDADGKSELITSAVKSGGIPEVAVYKVNTASGLGQWMLELGASFAVCEVPSDASLATGDVDGDGVAEIVVVCKNAAGTGYDARVYRGDGSLVSVVSTGSTILPNITVGDVNYDGLAELVLGDGSGSHKRALKVLDSGGAQISAFNAFTDSYGVRVSVGNLGY